MKSENRHLILMIFLIALFVFIGRLPGGWQANHGIVGNMDELEMTLSTMDRFIGVPSTSLAWPGSTLQLVAVPSFLLDFACESHFNISQSTFAAFISNQYRRPWHAVMLHRYIVMAVSSIGFAIFLIPLLQFTGSRADSIFGVAAMVTLPTVWHYSQMATGDALSMGFACLSITMGALKKRDHRIVLSGILMGIAAASKITIAFCVPFVLATFLDKSDKKFQDIILFLFFFLFGFVFFCPYAWVDPIRLVKSMIGSVLRPGTPFGLRHSLSLMYSTISIPILLLSVIGLFKVVSDKKWLILSGAMVTFCITLGSTSRSGIVYDRYLLPSIIPLIYLAAAGFGLTIRVVNIIPVKVLRGSAICIVIGALALIGNFLSYRTIFLKDQMNGRAINSLVRDIKLLHCRGKVAIPIDLLFYFAKEASSQSLEKLSENAMVVSPDTIKDLFAADRRVIKDSLIVLGRSFTEDEQAYVARLRAMAYTAYPNGIDLIVWGPSDMAGRYGIQDEKAVKSLYEFGGLCAAVTNSSTKLLQYENDRYYGNMKLSVYAP